MAVDIKQACRRQFEEVWNQGNYDVMDEVFDASYRGHDPVAGDLDLESAKQMARSYREAFPDLSCQFLGLHVAGDTCVVHWSMTGTHRKRLMNIEPTGARCTVQGITIMKFRGAKCVEDWTQWDALGLFRQLGVSPQLGGQKTQAPETRPHA
jgi:predicted ester cyclase